MDNFILLGIVLITLILAILLLKTALIRLLGQLLSGEVVELKKSGKDNYPVVEFEYKGETKSFLHNFTVSFKGKEYLPQEKVSLYYWPGFPSNIYIKGEDTLLALLGLFAISCLCTVFFLSR